MTPIVAQRSLLAFSIWLAASALACSSGDEGIETGTVEAGHDTDVGTESDAGTAECGSSATDSDCQTACELNTHREEVIPSQMYRVLSVLNRNSAFHESATIYVFKGKTTQGVVGVWVFGSGYGDNGANGIDSDLQTYMDIKVPGGFVWTTERNAFADASDVLHVITNCLGVSVSNADMNFVVPHGHLDHFNQEFFTQSAALGMHYSTVYVHENEFTQATCGSFFCGAPGPYAPTSLYFGVPYIEKVSASIVSKTIKLTGGDCSSQVGVLPLIETDDLGNVEVYHEWDASIAGGKKYSHTPGAINLRFVERNISLYGEPIMAGATFISKCPIPPGHVAYPAHGNIGVTN